MKYIVIALPGAADQSLEEYAGKTPFEMAKIPNLHSFVKSGRLGQVRLTPRHFDPHPDTTFLNLLGYDADKVYTGRGPLEAANLELRLEENEIAFRMNFITESDGILADPEGGRISTREAKALINFLNKKIASDFVRLFPGAGYRHLVVIKDAHGYDALSAKTHCPHDIVGKPVEGSLPTGPGAELLKKLMYDTRLLLQDHEINQVRVDLKENPANMIWVWGQGRKPHIEKFNDRFGCSGSVISDAEYAKGIARLAGMTAIDTKNIEGSELAVNYEEKAKLLLEELDEKDFVCLHLKECDEASRNGDLKAKVASLESADYFIFSKVKGYLDAHKDARVLVTPCHVLPWRTRKRVKDAVPFVISGAKIIGDDHEKFTEVIAGTSNLKLDKPSELMPLFFERS